MEQLPIVDKNAYLVITHSTGALYASLFYAHYDAGREYVLTDTSAYPDAFETLDHSFWAGYFAELESKFGWKLLSEDEALDGIYHVDKFTDEGTGVSQIKLRIAGTADNKSWLIRTLRSFSQDIKVEIYDPMEDLSKVETILKHRGYDDVLVLDLDLLRFDGWRIGSSSVSPSSPKHAKIAWTRTNGRNGLINTILDAKFKAFLSSARRKAEIQNMWANLVATPPLASEDPTIADLIRSYITVQLISLTHSQKLLANDFGLASGSACVVSGDILRLLDRKTLALAIIDGLQLKGSFDLYVDYDNLVQASTDQLYAGVNAGNFIVNQNLVFPDITRVYIPDMRKFTKKKKVVFDGLLDASSGQQHIYVLAGDYASIDLEGVAEYTLEGSFNKDFSPFVAGEDLSMVASSYGKGGKLKQIIVDARAKPVAYGPDPRANRDKLTEWLGI